MTGVDATHWTVQVTVPGKRKPDVVLVLRDGEISGSGSPEVHVFAGSSRFHTARIDLPLALPGRLPPTVLVAADRHRSGLLSTAPTCAAGASRCSKRCSGAHRVLKRPRGACSGTVTADEPACARRRHRLVPVSDMVRDCLASLREHAPTGTMHVVVVDNGSRDGTVEMIRDQFPEVELFCRVRTPGSRRGTASGSCRERPVRARPQPGHAHHGRRRTACSR